MVSIMMVWLSWPGSAQACSCSKPKLSVALQRSAAVFEGTVVAGYARRSETDSVMVVHGVFKAPGPLPPLVGVRHRTTSSCAFHMPVGTRYLVFADEDDGQLEVSMCSLTETVERAKELLEQLPQPAPRDNGLLVPTRIELDATASLGSAPVFKGTDVHALQVEFSAPKDREATVPATVALVVDLPTSAEQQRRAREAMRTLVEHLPDSTRVSVLSTATVDSSSMIHPLSTLDPEGRRQVDDLIDRVGTGTKGRLPDAIDAGSRSVVQSPFESSARFVVVVADGGAYSRGDGRRELVQAGARARDDHVVVSTLRLDPRTKAPGLMGLVEQGGGRVHAATDPVAGAKLEAQVIGSSRVSLAHVEFVPSANADAIGGPTIVPRWRQRRVTVRMGALAPGQRATTTLYVDVPPGLTAGAEVGTVVIRYWDPARAAGQTAAVLPVRRGTP